MKKPLSLILLLGLSCTQLRADPLTDATKAVDAANQLAIDANQKLKRDTADLVMRYRYANGGQCALLVVGNSSTNTVPIYFVPGVQPVAALQANITVDASVPITAMAQGPDAATYGKQLTARALGNTWTFLLVGLNQTAIGPGAMATMTVDKSKMASALSMITLSNFVGSDPNGVAVPMCVTTGVLTK